MVISNYKLRDEVCKFCGVKLSISVNVFASKLEDSRRDDYYQCPKCEKTLGDVRVNGNESVYTELIQ